ncbi:PEP-CTERM sorting domain-containing protein [Nitrosococcus wardiae]|uniref:PEP-CTERM sorting domain-containing protein n=2 Tax=Nitrosococcus wardiae TaxID=1814290 RepID=A0A4P7C1M8_9GAMM|nr:PEP-CTERM sorting domain-containing protein [Nitrosococcus wardiae]
MISNIGDFVADDFLMAPSSMSTDGDLGSGQLGAHLQSLAVNSITCPEGECSDSGFALGIYSSSEGGGGGPQEIPEPGVLALFGTGLLSLGLIGRRRKHLA